MERVSATSEAFRPIRERLNVVKERYTCEHSVRTIVCGHDIFGTDVESWSYMFTRSKHRVNQSRDTFGVFDNIQYNYWV